MMRTKNLFPCLALLSAMAPLANAADLVISEYIEGSSNNKAIELYNAGTTAVDLSQYELRFYFNGATSIGTTIKLQGTLAPNATHVVVNALASAELLAYSNQTVAGSWYNGDDAIVLAQNGLVVDSLGQIGVDPGNAWGDSSIATADMTLRRKSVQVDSDASNGFNVSEQWNAFAVNTFSDLGKVDFSSTPVVTLGNCGDAFVLPHQVQGNELTSALLGKTVIVEAVVSADFRGSDKLRGLYLQSPNSEYDNDPQTSEGIFVYDPNNVITAAVGSRIRVLANVAEFDGQTQLTQLKQSLDCAYVGNISATTLSFPLANANALEALEGMLVTFENAMTVSETYNLARYGEVLLSAGDRLWQPTEMALPGAPAQALMQQNNLRKIILDDASSKQNPSVIPYPGAGLSHDNPLRIGDEVRPFTAVMAQAFGAYRLQPTTSPIFDQRNPRRDASARSQDTTVRVASFNVLNFFNGDGVGGGFPTSRGASNSEELTRQKDKISTAIVAMNADIVGLMEMENDGDQNATALNELLAALNQRELAGNVWRAIETGKLGGDEIRVALIYRSDRVTPVGAAERLQTGAFASSNRVPVLQKFAQQKGLQSLTVVINHLKSKGSCPTDSADVNADKGDGQGCWNVLRTQAANDLANWLADRSANDRIVMMGDFNAYRKEDPVTALVNKGFSLLTDHDYSYSFVFDGQSGQLDHGFSNARLSKEVLTVQHWPINADEARALDYNMEFKSAQQLLSLYAATPARSSDHDPLLIDIGPRQFAHQYNNNGLQMLWGKQTKRFNFNVSDTAKVDAFEIKLNALYGNIDNLSFTLKTPAGVELPVSAHASGDSIKLLNAAALMPQNDLTGTWQLIVRQKQAGFGFVWGASLKLD